MNFEKLRREYSIIGYKPKSVIDSLIAQDIFLLKLSKSDLIDKIARKLLILSRLNSIQFETINKYCQYDK